MKCKLGGPGWYVVQARWCNYAWWKLRGAISVVPTMWCRLCVLRYVVQAGRCKLCGVSHVVQVMWFKLRGAR
eukprot:9349422-Pyramimonas_sp.AAC.1